MDHSCFKFSIGNFSIPVISGYDTYSVKIVGFAFGMTIIMFWGSQKECDFQPCRRSVSLTRAALVRPSPGCWLSMAPGSSANERKTWVRQRPGVTAPGHRAPFWWFVLEAKFSFDQWWFFQWKWRIELKPIFPLCAWVTQLMGICSPNL